MKIWFSNDSSNSGKKFYAVVQEVMIDKDGKPIYAQATAATSVVEPVAPVEPAVQPAEVAPANDNVTAVLDKLDELINAVKNSENTSTHIEHIETHEVVSESNTVIVESASAPAVEEVAPAEEVASTEEVALVDVVEESAVEEVAPVVVAPVADGAVASAPAKTYVRSRCFAEKMRDADEVLQDRYDDLKNYALRYRKLKARISRKFDSINQGRFQFVKLSVAGKTLKLYLNMDINTCDPKFHCKDMSDKKTYVTVPVLLRIKSGRAVKYAKRLIDQCAAQHGMLERRKPFEVDAMALIEESLRGPVADDNAVSEVAATDSED